MAAGLLAVAATYVSFLLWAQFGFLELLSERVGEPRALRLVMTVMGGSGLAVSFATVALLSRLSRRRGAGAAARLPVAAGLALSAVSPGVGLACHGTGAFAAAAALVGASTALLTVSLAAGLRSLMPVRRLGLAVGSATGAAYLLCNLPGVFDAEPWRQAVVVSAVCLAALVLLAGSGPRAGAADRAWGGPLRSEAAVPPEATTLPAGLYSRLGVAAATLSFLLLVGLDSAVFVIVQETPALRQATWSPGGGTLLQGLVHLAAAVATGAVLDAAGGALFGWLPVATAGLFAGGFSLLEGALPAAGVLSGGPAGGGATWGGVLYAAGISIYSVALVAYPAGRRDGPGLVPARWRAAWVYGIAGWLGSALGVGMAQDLHRVPRGLPVLVLVVLAVVWGAPAVRRLSGDARAGRVTAPLALIGLLVLLGLPGPPGSSARGETPSGVGAGGPDAVARGRRVYVAEGCIHCHSQYVRAGTGDEVLWGPAERRSAEGTPPLIGVRRQGPDLAEVGNRRTAAWQRRHLIEPRRLVPGSRMPSYAHLFAGDGARGADLVSYLQSLGAGTRAERRALVAESPVPRSAGSVARGGELFARHCASCHGDRGRGDGPLAAEIRGPDPDGSVARTMDLAKGAFWAVSWSPADRSLEAAVARTIRFGIPGTPMPGHETLSDRQVADLVAFVEELAWAGRRTGGGEG